MKTAYGSDFHFEFYSDEIMCRIVSGWDFDADTELIIIAGDLHVGCDNVVECLRFINKVHNKPIIYVPGNHEYYNSSFIEENKKFAKHWGDDGYHIILSGYYMMNGILFAGCMGNIDGSYEKISKETHGALNDFHLIEDFDDGVNYGKEERNELISTLFNTDAETAVVITHTMPSPRCISEDYKGSYLNACFANNWEREIVHHQPKYWICGHTHTIGKTFIHNTEVVMNPMGYPRENKNWKWRYLNV